MRVGDMILKLLNDMSFLLSGQLLHHDIQLRHSLLAFATSEMVVSPVDHIESKILYNVYNNDKISSFKKKTQRDQADTLVTSRNNINLASRALRTSKLERKK